MPTDIPISRKRGDNRRHTFFIKSKNVQNKLVPVDISNWTNFSMAVNSEFAPIDTTNQVDIISGYLTTDGTDGRVSFTPSKNVAPNTLGETYFYDVQGDDENGETITIASGEYQVIQDIDKTT